MEKNINIDEFINTLETGDILLYSTKIWYSKIIEYFSSSSFSHISIILKNPKFLNKKLKGLYVLESGFENTKDPIDNEYKFGVQITSLNKILNDYKNSNIGDLYYRQLEYVRNDKFYENFYYIYNKISNKPYDTNIFDWIKALFNIHLGNEKKTNKFWCSALVAFVYNKLNLIEDICWTIISPKDFSYYEDDKTIKYINCKLIPEKKIVF